MTAAVAVAATLLYAWLCDPVREHDGITRHDASVLDVVVRHRDGALNSLSRVVTELAAAPFVLFAAVGVGVWLWRRGAPRAWALVPAVSVALGALVATISKHHFARPRPPTALRLVHESGPSFPSGHTTVGTALVLAIGFVLAAIVCTRQATRLACVLTAVAAAFLIGVSRLELGVHWPTDIVGGWALGTATAASCVTGASVLVRFRLRPVGAAAR